MKTRARLNNLGRIDIEFLQDKEWKTAVMLRCPQPCHWEQTAINFFDRNGIKDYQIIKQ